MGRREALVGLARKVQLDQQDGQVYKVPLEVLVQQALKAHQELLVGLVHKVLKVKQETLAGQDLRVAQVGLGPEVR